MAERNAALGYMALGKETTKGTAVTPTIYVPYYDQNLVTDENIIKDQPIFGNKFRTYQVLQGHRSHKGSITAYGEPNTIGYWLDMLLTKTSTTGAGPYTHVFGLSSTTDPNSYTLDINLVSQVVRYFGVQASQMDLAYQGDELQPKINVSALGSFFGAELSGTPTGAGPYTIALTTTHDPSPTTGLVVGDLMSLKSIDGTRNISFTIASIVDGTHITTSTNVATGAAGDMIVLRGATPSFTLLPNFVWPNNQFCFGATAAAALSAAQTRLEPGSMISLKHDFKSADGENRSGAFDPASLVRMVGDADFKIKQYFDLPDQLKQWLAVAKNACVNRQYASGTTYELRTTLNNLRLAKLPIQTKFDEVIYQDEEYATQYDGSDAQGMSVTLINGTSTY